MKGKSCKSLPQFTILGIDSSCNPLGLVYFKSFTELGLDSGVGFIFCSLPADRFPAQFLLFSHSERQDRRSDALTVLAGPAPSVKDDPLGSKER